MPWISRVPDTSKEARAALQVADDIWHQEDDVFWASVPQAPDGERWVVVRTTPGEERARASLARQVEQTQEQWEKALWHPPANKREVEHLLEVPIEMVMRNQFL